MRQRIAPDCGECRRFRFFVEHVDLAGTEHFDAGRLFDFRSRRWVVRLEQQPTDLTRTTGFEAVALADGNQRRTGKDRSRQEFLRVVFVNDRLALGLHLIALGGQIHARSRGPQRLERGAVRLRLCGCRRQQRRLKFDLEYLANQVVLRARDVEPRNFDVVRYERVRDRGGIESGFVLFPVEAERAERANANQRLLVDAIRDRHAIGDASRDCHHRGGWIFDDNGFFAGCSRCRFGCRRSGEARFSIGPQAENDVFRKRHFANALEAEFFRRLRVRCHRHGRPGLRLLQINLHPVCGDRRRRRVQSERHVGDRLHPEIFIGGHRHRRQTAAANRPRQVLPVDNFYAGGCPDVRPVRIRLIGVIVRAIEHRAGRLKHERTVRVGGSLIVRNVYATVARIGASSERVGCRTQFHSDDLRLAGQHFAFGTDDLVEFENRLVGMECRDLGHFARHSFVR